VSLLPLILAKRDGRALSAEQIDGFVAALSRDELPDYQISALLMAIFFRGMSREETVTLTRAMAESGEMHDWDGLSRPTADKHSTGGVGDKLSLIVAPLAAAVGLAVPMLSGRGLGFTGGTLDKLDAIPGWDGTLGHAAFERQIRELGCAIIGQSEAIAPADRRLYALRDVTGCVESLPLIVSSILSKKLAAGPRSLVIDLKVGRGAFMTELHRARELGLALRETALAFGRRSSVLFTRMDAPLGRVVGNGPEVEEALDVLAGKGPADVRDLSRALTLEMAVLAREDEDRPALLREIDAALDGEQALETFLAMVAAQGGRLDRDAPGWGLPVAPHRLGFRARRDGVLLPPDARRVGELAVALGAGRSVATDGVDPTAGIRFGQAWGAALRRGDEVGVVEGRDRARVERAAAALEEIVTLGEEPTGETGLFLGLLDEQGFHPYALDED